MNDGFVRITTVSPKLKVADPDYNIGSILKETKEVYKKAPENILILFPELAVTGYTCEDLFFQPILLKATEKALEFFLRQTKSIDSVVVLGLPVPQGNSLYNCAAVCQKGKLLGLVPKSALPNYSEFSESRCFTPAPKNSLSFKYAGQEVVLGSHMIFTCENMPEFKLGIEICEDLWQGVQPSQSLTNAGATVIANLSASPEYYYKEEYRLNLITTQSFRHKCAYIYVSSNSSESTNNMVFSGQNIIAENGVILEQNNSLSPSKVTTEIDVEYISFLKRRNSFEIGDLLKQSYFNNFTEVSFEFNKTPLSLKRKFHKFPFVPEDKVKQNLVFEKTLEIQSYGLAKRLEHTNSKAVLGLSGGLDSTLALIVIVRAYKLLERPLSDLVAITMPGFGTTERTLNNSRTLAKAFGVKLKGIDISKATELHLKDIGHNGTHDITYENAQSRERTQVLMDVANQVGGLVVGTGDLSEMALGWATYNGDHMSMYGVNASVPKTMVRALVSFEKERLKDNSLLYKVLNSILDTPVSPELLPPNAGDIAQKTEHIVGPYELHDFFLYYLMKFGYSPAKIYRIAKNTFENDYDSEEIKKWITIFFKRFITQQFKRSTMPESPRVGEFSFSPRGDFKMPSDASLNLWLNELETL